MVMHFVTPALAKLENRFYSKTTPFKPSGLSSSLPFREGEREPSRLPLPFSVGTFILQLSGPGSDMVASPSCGSWPFHRRVLEREQEGEGREGGGCQNGLEGEQGGESREAGGVKNYGVYEHREAGVRQSAGVFAGVLRQL